MSQVFYGALFTIFFLGFPTCFSVKNSYTAAVVDYVHTYSDYPNTLLSENVEEYLKIMWNASKEYADIIVFPEYGLVDIFTMYSVVSKNVSGLNDYSSFVPDPDLNVVPCEDTKFDNVSMHVVKVSCAARAHSLYTVINLLEKEKNNETGELEFFNTNVIFNKQGAVVAKYRKIHLSEEGFLKPGTQLVTFETDFGVTFGIFTCFDMLFSYPALDLLTMTNVTDVIFTTSWFSETPFLQALSIQHGYSKTNGINLLASGLQESTYQDGGSGIFLADGTIAESYISNNRVTKIVLQEVPIITSRMPASLCMNTSTNTSKKTNQKKIVEMALQNDIDNFPITREDITGYVLESLGTGPRTDTQICTKEEEFCCRFTVTVDRSQKNMVDYTYMMGIYKGLSKYGSNIFGGVQNCALIACLNDSDPDTCGLKINVTLRSLKFSSILITTTLDKTSDSYIQPSTLRQDLTPVSDYNYCVMELDNATQSKYMIWTTEPQEMLLTFGLYGRLYNNDVVLTVAPPPELKPLKYTLIIIIVSFSVIVLICTAGLLYKFCMKQD